MPSTSTTAADLTAAVSSYARGFHATADKEHHVASPLGAWILLALCATASEGRLRDELSRILGVDVDTAASFAATLLSQPHPAADLATGVWTSRKVTAASAAGWLARLPTAVDRGELPSPAVLDAWAEAHTHGMIRRVPVELTPATMLILATVLATKVSWETPFIPITAAHRGLVGSTMWSGNVERVLKTPEAKSHDQFIAATERAGDVGVHTADAEEGMSVTSVIAERGVSPSEVIATAYEIGCGRHVPRRSLFDLPLGISPMWRITEQPIETTASNGREEKYEAVLPAWHAEASHDLGSRRARVPGRCRGASTNPWACRLSIRRNASGRRQVRPHWLQRSGDHLVPNEPKSRARAAAPARTATCRDAAIRPPVRGGRGD